MTYIPRFYSPHSYWENSDRFKPLVSPLNAIPESDDSDSEKSDEETVTEPVPGKNMVNYE